MPLDSPRNRFIAIATGAYLVFALAWIFLSDRLLEGSVDVSALIWLSTAKGAFFVVSTAGMFFVAMHAVPSAQAPTDAGIWGSASVGTGVLQAPRWMVYVFAVMVTVLLLLVRTAMSPDVANRPMLVLCMMPIIFSALMGGLGPGLLSTGIAALGAFGIMRIPMIVGQSMEIHDLVQWSALIANGLAISVLSEVLRHALFRAQNGRRLLEDVVSGTSDAVFVKDLQGRYLLGNQAMVKLLNKPLREILGRDDYTLFSSASARHLMALDAAIMRAGVTQTHEERLQLQDGQDLVFLVTKGPVRDASGNVSGLFGVSRDITERHRAREMLEQREHELARVVEGSDQGFWDWNVQTNVFKVSGRFESMLGYAQGEMDLRPENWGAFVHPDDLALSMASVQRHLAGETAKHELDLRCKSKSGEWHWIHTRGRVVEWDARGKPLVMAGSHTDVTQQKALELAQREASTVFESSYEGLMVVDVDGLIAKVNPAFVRITGYAPEEVIGQSPRILSSGKQDSAFYRQIWEAIEKHSFWQGEIWNRRKSGEIYAELLSISVVRNDRGAVEHYVAVFSDISRLKAHEAELDRIAHFDPLTGVPNRRLLADRMAQALARTSRSASSLAVCYLDLDGFKQVNDQFGHAAGDQLLIGVAEHLKRILRAEDTLARLGGDEFVMLLADIGSPEECSVILERVLAAVSEPVSVNAQPISVSASIGVSLFPQDHADADTLLRHADQAMYQAKEAGRNRFHLFDQESDRKAQLHRNYLERVQLALQRDELVLYYQPKVDLRDGQVLGVEALVRWRHPERGLLPPSEFLPHILGSPLEQGLGEWVIRSALAQAAAWHAQGHRLHVGVNIAAAHLIQADFYDRLVAALAIHPQLAPSVLELEVLETAAFGDIDAASAVLHRCHALGVRFALDDFGTGYSSLTYLRKLSVDTLKIDQSFVRSMLTDADDRGIVDSVIRLADAFKREVIAEGVETLEIGQALLAMGCHQVQGYGVARPMPAEELPGWIAAWLVEKRWRCPDSA